LDEAREELASDREALESADRRLTEAETEAMAAAVAAVRGGDEQFLPGWASAPASRFPNAGSGRSAGCSLRGRV
jgi:hypothetical protein